MFLNVALADNSHKKYFKCFLLLSGELEIHRN